MTTGRGNLEAAGEAWRGVRDDPDIQFEPIKPEPPDPPPQWWSDLERFLAEIFGPVARTLVDIWPWLQWLLLGVGLVILAYIVWRLVEPSLRFGGRETAEVEGWMPERAAALALLEDADKLAEAGDFSGAVHLLLDRSVGQIAQAQPDLVAPSSTARELSAVASLPQQARAAFAVIATAVERSLFALQELGREDWQKARSAYADFALERLS